MMDELTKKGLFMKVVSETYIPIGSPEESGIGPYLTYIFTRKAA
jgi:hypothetical protein